MDPGFASQPTLSPSCWEEIDDENSLISSGAHGASNRIARAVGAGI